MQRIFTFILCILLIYPLSAQEPKDSLHTIPSTQAEFKPTSLILPASLIAVGSLGFIEPFDTWKQSLGSEIQSWRGTHSKVSADEYLRFVPAAGVYLLSLMGANARHTYVQRTVELGISAVSMGILAGGLKYLVKEQRPDGSSCHSFPSGHSAVAFMGAELIRIEYGDDSPWYTVGAYTIATGVAALRLYNNRHWVTDVIAGAGIGILSAQIGHWLLPYTMRLFQRNTGKQGAIMPVVSPEGASLALNLYF